MTEQSSTNELSASGSDASLAVDYDVPGWFAAALADEPRTSMVAFERAEIEVLEWGDPGNPGIHLLHGFRAHAGWWRHIGPLLSSRYHVVASSWTGMGRSSQRPAYSLELYAREAMAVGQATGLYADGHQPVIVAHSLGGHTGAFMAAQYGERFGGVVLLDVGLGPEPKKRPVDPSLRIFSRIEEGMSRFRLTPAQNAEPFIVRQIAQDSFMRCADGEGWQWCFDPQISAKLERPHYWDQIPRIKCPAAFVRGERSRIVPDWLEKLQRAHAAPGTSFIDVPLAGHHLMLDQPIALVTTLRTLAAVWLD